MSVWRRKAISIAPELRAEFEQKDCTISAVFIELLFLLEQAILSGDEKRIAAIYEYAEWCLNQNGSTIWNATGVVFYEHLADKEILLNTIHKYVSKKTFKKIDALLEQRLDNEIF